MNSTSDQKRAGSTADDVLVALRQIVHSMELNSRLLVKRVGLTGPQLVILREVADTGEASVGRIARSISLSQGTVTDIVERMEGKGLLERRRSNNDRRRVLVQATPKGMALLETAPPLMQESFVERFTSLPDWEQTMILSALQRLVSIMETN